jgi:hypothetical protein
MKVKRRVKKKRKNPNPLFHPLDLVFWDLVLKKEGKKKRKTLMPCFIH